MRNCPLIALVVIDEIQCPSNPRHPIQKDPSTGRRKIKEEVSDTSPKSKLGMFVGVVLEFQWAGGTNCDRWKCPESQTVMTEPILYVPSCPFPSALVCLPLQGFIHTAKLIRRLIPLSQVAQYVV